jgi:hypothetical protein
VDALPKGYPQGADGAREASESSPFQSAATFLLAKITEQAIGASRAGLSLSGWVRSIPTPSALNWLKSSFQRLSEKGYKQHSVGEYGWCRAGEIGRNTPLRRPGVLRCRLLQGFSDSL